MNLLSDLKTEDLLNKTIFIRVDFNVPLRQNAPGRFSVTDDQRMRRFLDTSFRRIHDLTHGNCKIIIGSHLGRPHKHANHTNWDGIFNLQFVCSHFETLLKKEYEDTYIVFPPESMDSQFMHSIEIIKKNQLPLGGIKFLPNLRYLFERKSTYRTELMEDLSNICDVYINCAFGTCHRETRSIVKLPELMKKKGKIFVGGVLIEQEISRIGKLANRIVKHPEQSAFIAGGAKISDKIEIIKQFTLAGVSKILLGGKMVNTFLLAKNLVTEIDDLPEKIIPTSEEDKKNLINDIKTAKEILDCAKENGVEIVFPCDYKVSSTFNSPRYRISVIPDFDKELQLDIGTETIKKYSSIILDPNLKNIFWNGPLGAFDHPTQSEYAEGSVNIAKLIVRKCTQDKDTLAVLGGGDSAAIVRKFNLTNIKTELKKELDKMIPDNINRKLFEINIADEDPYTFISYLAYNFFISTGGGASLEFLEFYIKNKGQVSIYNCLPGTRALIN